MRKIKHYAGYGTVMAGKIKDDQCKLHVQVRGNHEWGIETHDEWLLYCWLVRRFDKNVPEYNEWYFSRPIIDVRSGVDGDTITCDYCFTY